MNDRSKTGGKRQGPRRIAPAIDFRQELANLFDLSGKIAFLPGGYGGIGEAIAWGLAQRGATVAIAGRSKAKADALARELRRGGHVAAGFAMDATRLSDLERGVDAIAARFGAIDILINCLGRRSSSRSAA